MIDITGRSKHSITRTKRQVEIMRFLHAMLIRFARGVETDGRGPTLESLLYRVKGRFGKLAKFLCFRTGGQTSGGPTSSTLSTIGFPLLEYKPHVQSLTLSCH